MIADYDKNFITLLCQKIIQEFDKGIRGFYSIEDLEKGFVYSKDREGNFKNYSLMTLSIAVIAFEGSKFKSTYILSKESSKLKEECKEIPKSNFLIREV